MPTYRTFQYIEEYIVSNLQYRVYSILKNCDFFVFFASRSSGGKSSSKATSRGEKGKSRDKLIDAFSDEDSNNSLTERQIPMVQRAHQTGDDWRSRFERTGVDSRACCREVKNPNRYGGVILWCLFMYRIDS